MKKKTILVTAVVLLSTSGLAQEPPGDLGITLDFTYLNSYIWRGFDMYGESRNAIQPSLDLDLYDTGLGLNIFWSRAMEGGRENLEELRYSVYYGNSLVEDETYATNYKVGYTYYNYPDMPKKAYNMQEVFTEFSWPKIFPAGFVPSYTIVCSWPAEGESTLANKSGGWLHIFGLGYDLSTKSLLPETPEQVLHLSALVVYNDGAWDFASPGGNGTVDHDWSHAVFGLSTDFGLVDNFTLTPAVYYQSSWDDSVNPEDETWCGLSMKYKF